MADLVIEQLNNGVFTLVLNRPEKLNCINFEMLELLESGIAKAEQNDAVRVVVIKGAGDRAFSTGGDLKAFDALTEKETVEWIQKGQAVFTRLDNLPKPTIAVIRGYAYGGGLELALACDFRLASTDAVLCLPELLHGWPPGWGALTRLKRLVGEARAKEMIFLAQPVDAISARGYGLLTAVVERAQLRNKLEEIISPFFEIPSDVFALAKAALQDTSTVNSATVAYDALAALYSKLIRRETH